MFPWAVLLALDMRCGLQKKFPPELSSRVVCCINLLNLWDMFNWRPCISAVLLQYESLQKENDKIKKEVRCLLSCCLFFHPLFFFLALLRSVCGLKGNSSPKNKIKYFGKIYIFFSNALTFIVLEHNILHSVIFTHLHVYYHSKVWGL